MQWAKSQPPDGRNPVFGGRKWDRPRACSSRLEGNTPMKSILRITAAGVAIASFGFASAASAATETATAEAEILAALDVTLDATRNTLDFGSIAESGAGGTVTLTPAGALTCGAGLVCSGTTETPN